MTGATADLAERLHLSDASVLRRSRLRARTQATSKT
jgi:hypothetical protein